MPRQRAIRFPDDLHDAIEAEARRLGHPHTFSSVVVNDMRVARGVVSANTEVFRRAAAALRGSPSPSFERFKGKP